MVYLRPVEEWKDGEEGCSAQKRKVSPQTRRRQPQCQNARGEKNEMGIKGVQKRDSTERETERESMLVQEKQTQCTQETQDKHTSLTVVCNQADDLNVQIYRIYNLMFLLQQSHDQKSKLSKHTEIRASQTSVET